MVNVLVLGSNSGGQLGTNNKQDAHTPTPISFACDAPCSIVGGGNHALAWPQNGTQLHVCGSNTDGELGMCTHGENEDTELMWKSVKFPGSRVVQAACGWNHTLVLDEDGVVMGSGCNTYKQLVHEDMSRIVGWTNVGLDGSNKFSAIACGMRHSMALSQSSQVYAWGANRSGQLGVPPNTLGQLCVSNELPLISMIACGRNHSVIIAHDKRTVFVAGQDKYGQCGPSSMPVAGSWRSFVLLRPAKKLCSGWDTCAVVLEPSEHEPYNVVMWGRADHGQLACDVGKYSRELVTVRLANVIDMVCGSNHSIARTSDGDVYLWGWNEHGNAGDPSLRDVYEPLKLAGWPQGADTVVAGIGCGYGNSYIMLDKLSNVPEAHPNV
ncbi:alpha tubulin suppressor [Coemansia sp. RSA 1972]|nr:alpha tubulin suppressor [Coemansia sp. RSA 1972]